MKTLKYIFSCGFLLLAVALNAQEVLRSNLGVTGSSQNFEEGGNRFTLQQSVGQQSVIGTYGVGGFTMRQGFIQPPVRVQRIFESETALNAVVYPNPFKSLLYVRFGEEVKGMLSVKIFDLAGKLVYDRPIQAQQQVQIELDFLSSGEYLLTMDTEDKNFTATILKN